MSSPSLVPGSFSTHSLLLHDFQQCLDVHESVNPWPDLITGPWTPTICSNFSEVSSSDWIPWSQENPSFTSHFISCIFHPMSNVSAFPQAQHLMAVQGKCNLVFQHFVCSALFTHPSSQAKCKTTHLH